MGAAPVRRWYIAAEMGDCKMSRSKKVMIITLLCVNVALVGTLVFTSMPKAQAQQGTPFPATDYIAVTARVNSDLDALCIVDLASQQMAVWKWNEGRNRLETVQKRSLPSDLGITSR